MNNHHISGLSEPPPKGTTDISDSKLNSPILTSGDSEIYDEFDPYLDSDSAVLGLYHSSLIYVHALKHP